VLGGGEVPTQWCAGGDRGEVAPFSITTSRVSRLGATSSTSRHSSAPRAGKVLGTNL
jgi:hypothetical protein